MKKRGITLVEVIIATGIFSMVVVLAGKFASDVLVLNSVNQSRFSAEQDSRKVLRPMITEIRSASQSSIGSYPIEQAGTSSLVFYSDVDDDGIKEKVRYFLQNGSLKRGEITPTGSPFVYSSAGEEFVTLIENVISTTTPIFYYYDTSYTGTSSPLSMPAVISSIRLVKIKITIDKNPNALPGPITVEGQVSIRNLKDNL